jgi:drug/metabolite transporter (DMT)-like permease
MGQVAHDARLPLLVVGALTGFAANSLLCRAALAPHLIDPVSFTAVRLVAGAAALALIARGERTRGHGSWASAAALFAYAIAFSLAYVWIGAGVGALVLFGAVQVTMIGAGLAGGERPGPAELVGLGLAMGGLGLLTLPGAHAVAPAGAALMAVAGMSWGVYSLRGRRGGRPLAVTTDNFARSVPFVAALAVGTLATGRVHATALGLCYATLSGALASGVGYSLWYAALPALSATRAAILQLAVPPLAAGGAVLLLGESWSWRFVTAAGAILGGVALALLGRARPAARG